MKHLLIVSIALALISSGEILARIGGTVAEFQASELSGVFELQMNYAGSEGAAFHGKSDVMVALFKGPDGTVVKQRLKWLGNNFPKGEAVLLTMIIFCMEATGTKDSDEDRNVLIDRMGDAIESHGTFKFRGYDVLIGLLDDPSSGMKDHLTVEVSK